MQDTAARLALERGVLEELYSSCGGEGWYRFTGNWLSAAPVGQWWGITVDSLGFVKEIISYHNLTGKYRLAVNCCDTYLPYLKKCGARAVAAATAC